jgi:hypothetical protein
MSDVDLDFGDRNEILSKIEHTCAMLESGKKHNSGIYVTMIPKDIVNGTASINFKEAEELGYYKIDLLNNSLYKLFRNPEHLEDVLSRPIPWHKLKEKSFVEKLMHIGNYYELLKKQPEPITSIEELAFFLSIIRPGKKSLQGMRWKEIAKTVWDRDNMADGYIFRKSHAIAYAIGITAQMRVLLEQE